MNPAPSSTASLAEFAQLSNKGKREQARQEKERSRVFQENENRKAGKNRFLDAARRWLEMMFSNLESQERMAYSETFASFRCGGVRGGAFASAGEPACLDFLKTHCDMPAEELEVELAQLVSPAGGLPMIDFLRLLREHAVSESDVVGHFARSSGGSESVTLADCKKGLEELLRQKLRPDFSRSCWDCLLDAATDTAFGRVMLPEWSKYCKMLFRVARLLCHLGLERKSIQTPEGLRAAEAAELRTTTEDLAALDGGATTPGALSPQPRAPGRLADVLANLEVAEKKAYAEVHASFLDRATHLNVMLAGHGINVNSSSSSASPAACLKVDDFACRAYILANTEIREDELDGVLLAQTSGEGSLSAENFQQVLIENTVSDYTTVQHFTEVCGTHDQITVEECEFALLRLARRRFAATGLNASDWDDILDVVMPNPTGDVDVCMYMDLCKVLFRVLRLLGALGLEKEEEGKGSAAFSSSERRPEEATAAAAATASHASTDEAEKKEEARQTSLDAARRNLAAAANSGDIQGLEDAVYRAHQVGLAGDEVLAAVELLQNLEERAGATPAQ